MSQASIAKAFFGLTMVNASHLRMHRAQAGNVNVTVVASPDVSKKSELAAAALEQKIQHLADELRRVEQELRTLKAGIAEPKSEDSSAKSHKQSELACKILVGFCVRNVSELPEGNILEMCSEDRITVRAALAEMCDQGLMAVTGADSAERTYAVTSLGQRQVFAYRTLGVVQGRCEASDETSP